MVARALLRSEALRVVPWLRPCTRIRLAQGLRARHNPTCPWSPQPYLIYCLLQVCDIPLWGSVAIVFRDTWAPSDIIWNKLPNYNHGISGGEYSFYRDRFVVFFYQHMWTANSQTLFHSFFLYSYKTCIATTDGGGAIPLLALWGMDGLVLYPSSTTTTWIAGIELPILRRRIILYHSPKWRIWYWELRVTVLVQIGKMWNSPLW